MKIWVRAFVFYLLVFPFVQAENGAPKNNPAEAWWSHVAFLADDTLAGREAGSEGHRKAAEYVATSFQRVGLKPSGSAGYIQPVPFRSRRIVEDQSSLALVRDGKAEAIQLGDEAFFNMRIDHAPQLESPVVFVGYGLKVPEVKYDDLAGLDLRGKVVLLLSGGPSTMTGPLRAHYEAGRWQALRKAGAIGVLTILNPKGMTLPWERRKLSRLQASMTLVDASLDENAGQRIAVTVNPDHAEKFFGGSGYTFQQILDLQERGKPLPKFALPARIRAAVKVEASAVESQNVVGILPGTDPKLKKEYVVLTAHLDHLGDGQPINGDSIYNGAMDNASGIATLIETAAALGRAKKGLRRSVIFVAVTAEEKGLLGSKYFAVRPVVPATAIVANINTDMFLPLFPFRGLIAQGIGESDLAKDLRQVAEASGITIFPDPEPEQNGFIRSDQYSFIKRGVPALALKAGYAKDSPEHEVIKRWRAERYHAPSDDLNQPVDLQAAADFNKVYLRLIESIANRPQRPRWNSDSPFRRAR